MKCLTLSACVVALLCVVSTSQGALLNLTQNFPDISADQIEISYNAGTSTFSAIGDSIQLQPGALTISNNVDKYVINATISPAGVLSAGTIVIGGDIVGPPAAADPLLTGNLIAFGYPEGPDAEFRLYEFLFQITGGSLASQFGGIGRQGGVILSGQPITTGDADDAFPNSFTTADGAADNFTIPVPEPTTAGMVLMAGAGAIGWRRRRRAA